MADTKISQLAVADSLDDAVKIPILESDLTNKSTTTNTFWNYIKNKSDAVYQPLDGDLSAIAALTTTGLIEKTGANTASIVTITSAGKDLLDDVSPTAQRTTLGLGSASTMTGPSGSIVGTTDNQILTNKTISADNNTLSGIAASSFVLSNASGNIDGSAAQKVIPAGSVVGTTDTQTLDNKSLSSLNGGPLAGFRNWIINGNFNIWQRGTSFTSFYDGFTADRCLHSPINRAYTQYASITTTKGTNELIVTSASTDLGFIQVASQSIELPLSEIGKTYTYSFWFKKTANMGGSLGVAYRSDNTLIRDGTFIYIKAMANIPQNEYVRYSVTFTIPSFSNFFAIGVYLNQNINVTTSGIELFRLKEIQFEAGSVATPFEHRPYGVELALCQRYYIRFGAYSSNPNWYQHFPAYTRTANANGIAIITFPVTMRTSPTALEQNGTASDYFLDLVGQTLTLSSVPTFVTGCPYGVTIGWEASGIFAVGSSGLFYPQGITAYLGFSAEL